MKFVTLNRLGTTTARTTTLNEQDAELWASDERHETEVAPTGKDVPDCGVHDVWMGMMPPAGVGGVYVTFVED